MDRNPNYWRQYRAEKPDSADKNRGRQRTKVLPPSPAVLAKTDESNWPQVFKAGIYRITPVEREIGERSASWTVELSPICLAPDCKKVVCKGDACKDRT